MVALWKREREFSEEIFRAKKMIENGFTLQDLRTGKMISLPDYSRRPCRLGLQ